MKKEETKKSKTLSGTVVSAKMQKTIVVAVSRFEKHPKYGKYMKITKKYKAHDEEGKFKEGDKVLIQECRPISKDKTFKVVNE